MFNNILTEDELEALLAPEELEAYKAERYSGTEQELMLNPAHLLLAIRELEEKVVRIFGRVGQLEEEVSQLKQAAQAKPVVVPEARLGLRAEVGTELRVDGRTEARVTIEPDQVKSQNLLPSKQLLLPLAIALVESQSTPSVILTSRAERHRLDKSNKR